MSLRLTLATAQRLLRQLRHDRRTIALLLVVPAWLGTLHQANAVLVLTAALLALRRLPSPPPRRGAA